MKAKGVLMMRIKIIGLGVLLILLISMAANAEQIRFAVLGDTQGRLTTPVSEEAFTRIVRDVLAADPPVQFVVIVGDLVSGIWNENAHRGEYQVWKQLADPWYQADFYGLKVYVLPGNHDEPNFFSFSRTWREAFPYLPDNGPADDKQMTYSFDVGPCHLVAVNTSTPTVFKAHTVNVKWLREDLQKSNKPIKLVFGHEPAYKVEKNRVGSLDCQGPLRDEFWKILTENGVKAYFCGHDHGYDHWVKDNVHQIITAGGGGHGDYFHYTLVDADETDVTVSIYHEPENQLAHTYKLSDTAGVPSEDRTPNDDPYWPYNAAPCNWASTVFMIMLFAGFASLGPIFSPVKP
jgi:hypothetical protein